MAGGYLGSGEFDWGIVGDEYDYGQTFQANSPTWAEYIETFSFEEGGIDFKAVTVAGEIRLVYQIVSTGDGVNIAILSPSFEEPEMYDPGAVYGVVGHVLDRLLASDFQGRASFEIYTQSMVLSALQRCVEAVQMNLGRLDQVNYMVSDYDDTTAADGIHSLNLDFNMID